MKLSKLILFLFFTLFTLSSFAETNANLIRIEGGQYIMGIEGGLDNPAHSVRVDSFLLSRFEVTVGEWREFTNVEPNFYLWGNFEFTFLTRRNNDFQPPSNWAMYYITWYDAVWYCNWRSLKEGLKPAYIFDTEAVRKFLYDRGKKPTVEWDRKANGYRLPTEAEWEYAAKGGKSNKEIKSLSLFEIELEAWTISTSNDEVHPVGIKRSNSLGIFDIFGNVGEWVWDYYDAKYYKVSPRNNPVGPKKGIDPKNYDSADRDIRSNRGGCWVTPTELCNPSYRFRSTASQRSYIGLRLARNAQ